MAEAFEEPNLHFPGELPVVAEVAFGFFLNTLPTEPVVGIETVPPQSEGVGGFRAAVVVTVTRSSILSCPKPCTSASSWMSRNLRNRERPRASMILLATVMPMAGPFPLRGSSCTPSVISLAFLALFRNPSTLWTTQSGVFLVVVCCKIGRIA